MKSNGITWNGSRESEWNGMEWNGIKTKKPKTKQQYVVENRLAKQFENGNGHGE